MRTLEPTKPGVILGILRSKGVRWQAGMWELSVPAGWSGWAGIARPAHHAGDGAEEALDGLQIVRAERAHGRDHAGEQGPARPRRDVAARGADLGRLAIVTPRCPAPDQLALGGSGHP